ncbi:MAG: SGNH/GDSL hydrolase family protein [Clostridia bacterium]|nr:SGNH/GDSL hydrolase family protein [Clostridia bacterium]
MVWVENGSSEIQFICSETKPNIFLIGDSIRKGYCKTVGEDLDGIAETFFFHENCRSSQFIIFNMKKWAGYFDKPGLVNLIHFNCGHWDVAHWSGHPLPLTSPEEYKKNLQIVVDLLHKFFPNAKLIFATTSPMNPDGSNGFNPRTTETINEYNSIAKKVMEANKVPIHDIYSYMIHWESDQYADSCHLTPEAFSVLGHKVANELKTYMEKDV